VTPDLFLDTAISPAFGLLPSRMGSAEARAMVLAIALQESELTKRRQMAGGPARGYCQFEKGGGVHGVLTHHASRAHAKAFCRLIDIEPTDDAVYVALEFNDLLCAAFARLLLWTSPLQLPSVDEPARGWRIYQDTWRPGKPHPETWDGCFARAWRIVVPGVERSTSV
jgi:hypothetical protein